MDDDRRPTMDETDLAEFVLRVAGAGVLVGMVMIGAVWVLPWWLAIVIGTAIPGAAALGLKRWMDRWWQEHSVPDEEVGGDG